MHPFRRTWFGVTLIVTLGIGTLLSLRPQPAQAYVEAAMSLGAVIFQSTNVMVLRIEKVDKEKNMIIYRKVRDLKGVHPTDVVKHNIGRGGFHPREWQFPMEWAEVGKTAIFFHNGGASETCIGNYWYQAYAGGEWWNMSHGEPFLLRSYAGNVEKLAAAVTEVNAGREAIVSCMIDGNKDDLHMKRAKIQRLRVSLKLQDYNPKRDFVGWGGEDFRRIAGMPGFTHYSALSRVDPDAQAIASVDFDGDGKPDLCLVGAGKVVVLQNSGETLSEVSLPGGISGCRAAIWADYNGDGKPDLFLATPTGPRLFTNLGGSFRDDTHLLPKEACYDLTAAAWIDYDGDGKPDLLLGNGFHGLRLYRNQGLNVPPPPGAPKFGKWHYIGPFDNTNQRGFETVYPPEKEIVLTKTYPGKNGEQCTWKEGKFTDGAANDLLPLFKQKEDAACYIYREIESAAPQELPLAFGSDDTLTVWFNGEKIVSQNEYRAAAPGQASVKVKLKAGKNTILMKICQGYGDWAFIFEPGQAVAAAPEGQWFVDVSEKVGLGPNGIGSTVKGDTLTVRDVDGDGRPDFLYGAGTGMLVLNTPKGFVEAKDSGISYKPGKIGPVFFDYDGDGHPDLFIPQNGSCKLYKNDGRGHFTDMTAQAGDLAKFTGQATCAAWGDLDNDGHADLIVGCLRGPNRFFRNKGDGTFEDATEAIGLHQRIFNTQAVCLVDLNNDGMLDVVFNNEGQESAVLLGNPAFAAKKTPVTVQVAGTGGVVGSKVRVLDKAGKAMGQHIVSGGDGRGGQTAPQARFALQPGTYRVEVTYSSGIRRAKDITVATSHFRGTIDDQTPKME